MTKNIMGSFDVACSVSHVTINEGDPVAYFLLEKTGYGESDFNNRFLMYPNCYWEPICLPIMGEYADYGKVNIIHNEHTEFIEKHFKKPIDEMVNESPTEENSNEASMFVHREVYDHLVGPNHFDDLGNPSTGLWFLQKRTIEEQYDRAMVLIREAYDEAKRFRELGVNTKEFYWTGKLSESNIFTLSVYHYRDFNELYFRPIMEGLFKKELCDFWRFTASLPAINKIFSPAMSGYQHGNHYENRSLVQKTLEILDKKIEHIEEEKEYWDG